jgi:hypothetical protein
LCSNEQFSSGSEILSHPFLNEGNPLIVKIY